MNFSFGLLIEVVDPEGKMLYTKDGGVKGRFAFSTMISGEHSICYRTNTARWFAPKNQVKVVLSTSTNEEDVSQDELASQEEILGGYFQRCFLITMMFYRVRKCCEKAQ